MADDEGEGTMNTKRLMIATALSVLLTGLAGAQDKPLPLSEAFQNYCAKSDGSPQAVEAAIARGNGKRLPIDPAVTAKAAADKGMPNQDISMWDVSVPDHKMMLTLTAHKSGLPYAPQELAFACMVLSTVNEDDSIAAVSKWTGVAPVQLSPNDQQKIFVYRFEVQGDQHLVLLPGSPGTQAAEAEGRIWALIVVSMKEGGMVQLVRMAPKSN
jgi:hypothetical protein